MTLRLAHVVAPARVGGAEQVVLDLTKVLATRDVDVHLLPILDIGGEDHPFLARTAQAVTVHPLFLSPRRYRAERQQVRAVLRDIGANVVHTHGYRADVVDGGVARRLGVGTVTTVHGFTGGGLRNRLYEWVQRRAFRRFDAVVAVSRPLALELEAQGIPAGRIHAIPNARTLSTDLLEPAAARLELDAPSEAFHVGWIGRVSREKGPDVMLSALERLVGEGIIPALRATFVGDGRQREQLESRTGERDLGHLVRWTGRIPDAARLFRAFDIIVVSSRTEGTPIVALEAMLAGVPLVATRVGGVPDLMGDEAALLVPPEDPDGLASAIETVFRDPEGAVQRVQRAQERVREIASPDAWADRYLEVYRQVSGSRTP